MTWEVEFTDEFEGWWDALTAEQQEAVAARVGLLVEAGPGLGRPTVDRIRGSRHANMKELRASSDGALRVLFAFDSRRAAILLIGGNKAGQWNDWYRTSIPAADDLFDKHMAALGREDPSGAKD